MKTQKCKMRQKRCSCIHRCNNKSSLKGGMHHNTADSLWNCLSQRLAEIGLIPHDVEDMVIVFSNQFHINFMELQNYM